MPSACHVKLQSGRECHSEQAGVLLLQLQSEMAKPPSDGEQLIRSQQQTFNYQINPVSLYCMTESQHHLLNVGRRWVWERLVGFPHRLNIQDPMGSAYIQDLQPSQPQSIAQEAASSSSPGAVVKSTGSGAKLPTSKLGCVTLGKVFNCICLSFLVCKMRLRVHCFISLL